MISQAQEGIRRRDNQRSLRPRILLLRHLCHQKRPRRYGTKRRRRHRLLLLLRYGRNDINLIRYGERSCFLDPKPRASLGEVPSPKSTISFIYFDRLAISMLSWMLSYGQLLKIGRPLSKQWEEPVQPGGFMYLLTPYRTWSITRARTGRSPPTGDLYKPWV